MDYFTKWVKAEPLSNIRDMDAKDLFGKILSLGLGSLILLFLTIVFSLIAKFFRRYCCDLGIMNRYSTPAYP